VRTSPFERLARSAGFHLKIWKRAGGLSTASYSTLAAGKAGISITSGGCSRFTRHRATPALEPIQKIRRKNASPTWRQLNEGWSLAERDRTLDRAACYAGDFGGFVIGVDDEPVFPRPRCACAPFVP
jgi:hypothetical protein